MNRSSPELPILVLVSTCKVALPLLQLASLAKTVALKDLRAMTNSSMKRSEIVVLWDFGFLSRQILVVEDEGQG